jgi:hypothetical protein
MMLVASSDAVAQQGSSVYSSEQMPPKVGDAKRGEVKDFEPANPGLGQAVGYSMPGWRITLFIYDLQRTDLPETAVASIITPQLEQAAGDIMTFKQKGDYADVDEGLGFVVPDGLAARFYCKSYVLKTTKGIGGLKSNNEQFDSYLCVTTWRKRFIKLRLTTASNPKALRTALEFVKSLDRALSQ